MCEQYFAVVIALGLVGVAGCAHAAKPRKEQPPSPTGFEVREAPARSMPAVCRDVVPDEAPMSACPLARQWFASATDSSIVRVCNPGLEVPDAATCPYKYRYWRRFDRVKPSVTSGTDPGTVYNDPLAEKIEVCTIEKTEGAPMENCPKEGSATGWGAMAMVEKEKVAKVPPMVEGTFTLEPEGGGVSPLEVTLRWNVTGLADVGAYPCNAVSDPPSSFDGTRAAVGDEKVAGVMADTAFTLTCVRIPPSAALASWDMPTKNTDGTPLTTLQGYVINYGNSLNDGFPALASAVSIPPDKTQWLFDKLTPVRWWFGIKARAGAADENVNESALSNIVYVDLKASSETSVQRFTQTLRVEVTQQPEPPPRFTVSESEAYKLNESPNDLSIAQVGVVPLGTPCDESQVALGKYVIDRATITPEPGQAVPDVVVATCTEGTWQPESRQ